MLHRMQRCDLCTADDATPDARALDRIGLETALRNLVLPLMPTGAITPVLADNSTTFRRLKPHLSALLGPVCCQLSSPTIIEASILDIRQAYLARRAEMRTPARESCRSWSTGTLGRRVTTVIILMGIGLFVLPSLVLWVLILWAALTLIAVTGLRSAAALSQYRYDRRSRKVWRSGRGVNRDPSTLPRISVLVPLFQERDIAARLVERLAALDYPRNKLEVALILEWDDSRTEAVLRDADLPEWMRIVRVPRGDLRTKPRAMNYALDFLSGDIIGIYDAEDAPARDQLLIVAAAFEKAPANVACAQGILDFYNAGTNALTRCFTIDYAVWFRFVLPGLARLGLVLPLGGTTVFFRRHALESLGRWDAHNVTEDADLGLRLARHGYRCMFLPTVTEEEATSTIPAWLRQRSRWIKGYAMTWGVHMRDPLGLLGELGPLRFLGIQILLLGTLSQFLLAPFLWSFWLIVFGLPHPIENVVSWNVIVALGALFFVSEAVTLLTAAAAVARPRHRWLIKWVPLMHLYFPLAAVASWKGFAEMLFRPYFWDKTVHGLSNSGRTAPVSGT